MRDRVGQHFGNYRLLQFLGEGGFAEVYLGEHLHLGSLAAIKVLQNRLGQDEVDRFREEARTIVRLKHPHIVRLLEFGMGGGTPFLVMDYAPGGTLRERHPKGQPVPLATLLPYVRQVADALHYAHEQQLIHRDIKPENMLLGERGEVLLSDFGIATVAQSSRYEGTQEVAGTVAYMAPEQLTGHPRPASDQYALGIVVYEWLSGSRPFQGSFAEIASQHLFAAPPALRTQVPTLPPVVEQVVFTALEKDPRHRFASLHAFATALEQASLLDLPTQVRPAAPLALPPADPRLDPLPPTRTGPSRSVPPAELLPTLAVPLERRPAESPAPTISPGPVLLPPLPLSVHVEPVAQASTHGRETEAASLAPTLLSGLSAQTAQSPAGATAPTLPPLPLPRWRQPAFAALVVSLLFVVLISGSLGVWGLTGNGPLAVLGRHPATVTPRVEATASARPGATIPAGPEGRITEFPLPHNSLPEEITAGRDGNLWFTVESVSAQNNHIGRITPTGMITEFPISVGYEQNLPYGITTGPDGNLWFTQKYGAAIGRITPAGTITTFLLALNAQPYGITAGPDGNLWFTEVNFGKIGRITPTGTITEFLLPVSTSQPEEITVGPDGNLWFTEVSSGKIGRITLTGAITEFPLPTVSQLGGIIVGADKNLWFTEFDNKIGRITPTGTITEFSLPTSDNQPYGITAGPDGNLWFTEQGSGKIGRITPTGTITEFSVPTSDSQPYWITAGPDGNLWFTEFQGIQIGRLTPGG